MIIFRCDWRAHLVIVALAGTFFYRAFESVRTGEARSFVVASRASRPLRFALLLVIEVLIGMGLLYYHLPPFLGLGTQ